MLARSCRVGKFSSAGGSSSSSTTVASRTSCRDVRAGCCSRSSSRTACARSHATSSWRHCGRTGEDVGLAPLLSKLRRVVPLDGLRPAVGELWVDIEAAAAAVHRAESSLALGDPHAAWGPSQVAMFVAGRPFLAGEEAPWIDVERLRLGELHLRALEAYAASTLGVGGTELSAAVRAGRKLVALEPYRESGYRILMEALDREGNPAEALLVYEATAVEASRRPRDQPVVADAGASSPPAGLTPFSASLAASCSASFFDRPVPVPTTSPSIIAAAVNVRSCGGPSTFTRRVGDRPARAREPLLQLRLVVDVVVQRVLDARLERRRRPRARSPRSRARGRARRAPPRAARRARCGCARAARRRPREPVAAHAALAELELARDDGAARARDDVRAHLRHPALGEVGEPVVERPRDRELEHRVARGTRAARTSRCGRRPTTNA